MVGICGGFCQFRGILMRGFFGCRMRGFFGCRMTRERLGGPNVEKYSLRARVIGH
jgi:hypothetical protein